MSTGQMVFTIIAFIFIFTILTNFYSLMATTGDGLKSSQDAILETSVASSWIDFAMGLSFDKATVDTNLRYKSTTPLTAAASLGLEADDTTSDPGSWDDFDDFNGKTLDKSVGMPGDTTAPIFTTNFAVYYVDPANINTYSGSKTFLKRMDLKVWRTKPAPRTGERLDTLKTSVTMGYFKFGVQ